MIKCLELYSLQIKEGILGQKRQIFFGHNNNPWRVAKKCTSVFSITIITNNNNDNNNSKLDNIVHVYRVNLLV